MAKSRRYYSYFSGNNCVIYCGVSRYTYGKIKEYAMREGLGVGQFVLKSIFAYMQWMDETDKEGSGLYEDEKADNNKF